MRARAALLACAIVAGSTTTYRSLARAAEENQGPTARTPTAAPPAPASPAPQADKPIVVWPTLTPAGDDVTGGAAHKPTPNEGAIYARAMELDTTLRDAVQDLGFALDVADPGPAKGHDRELEMVERAQRSATP
ncbi:MAG TPA: hypothetical protein VM580_34160, partial [Labilithrix sp.]|nr:hypothetical protein [Labilithrix sp.]